MLPVQAFAETVEGGSEGGTPAVVSDDGSNTGTNTDSNSGTSTDTNTAADTTTDTGSAYLIPGLPTTSGTEGSGTEGTGTEESGTEGSGTEGSGTQGSGTQSSGTQGSGTDGNGTKGSGNEGVSTQDTGTTETNSEWTKFVNNDNDNAIQQAVDVAEREDIQVVSIPPKPDGSAWHLTVPIYLPSYMTVILDGAVVEAEGVAFQNKNAGKIRNLGGEQHKIFLLGRHGGAIRGIGNAPQILLSNCRDCRIADLSFEGGAGVELDYVRYSKVQQLKFQESLHAVMFREGCNNIILESVSGETMEETIVACGGNGTVTGRETDICNSILCRSKRRRRSLRVVAVALAHIGKNLLKRNILTF
jgi:hypothetical protein